MFILVFPVVLLVLTFPQFQDGGPGLSIAAFRYVLLVEKSGSVSLFGLPPGLAEQHPDEACSVGEKLVPVGTVEMMPEFVCRFATRGPQFFVGVRKRMGGGTDWDMSVSS